MFKFQAILVALLLTNNCQNPSLRIISKTPSKLTEISGVTKTPKNNLLWVIEDSGNKSEVYGIDLKGNIQQVIKLKNTKNIDFEAITSDADGNLYVGDFGDNDEKRKQYSLYKVNRNELNKKEVMPKIINFTLPNKASANMEAFVLNNNYFYIFTKTYKSASIFRVPNAEGTHLATLVGTLDLKSKDNRITDAAISPDAKTIVLLNPKNLWELTNFNADDFNNFSIKKHPFYHNSQKEGLCFKDSNAVYVADEQKKNSGGYLYLYNLEIEP